MLHSVPSCCGVFVAGLYLVHRELLCVLCGQFRGTAALLFMSLVLYIYFRTQGLHLGLKALAQMSNFETILFAACPAFYLIGFCLAISGCFRSEGHTFAIIGVGLAIVDVLVFSIF